MTFDFFSGAPQNQAMLALAAGLLESGGPSRTPVGLGQGAARGMMAGREAFMQAQEAQMKQKLFDLKMAEAQKAQEQEAAKREWLIKAMQGGQPVPQMGVSPSSASAMNAPWASAANFPQSPAGPQPLSPQMLMQGLSVGAPIKDVLAIQEAQNPNLQYKDMGGYVSVRDKMGKEVERLPKTAAPGSIPSHLADLTPQEQRDWNLRNSAALGTNITNVLGAEDPFMRKIGEGLGTEATELRKNARVASNSITTIHEGRRLLDSGVITGAGAELITKGGQVLQRLGVPIGESAEQTISNTQAFAATMGREVGSVIKLFGSGTGLSDADREYAEKIAAGKITLNEGSLRKLLDINERINRAKIREWNKQGEEFLKTPQGKRFARSQVIIDEPEEYIAPEKTPSAKDFPAPTQDAIRRLKMNPRERDQFDEVFGPGASAKVLGK